MSHSPHGAGALRGDKKDEFINLPFSAEVIEAAGSLGKAARCQRVPVALVERILPRRPVGLLMLGKGRRVLRTYPQRGLPAVAFPDEHTLPPHRDWKWMRLRDTLGRFSGGLLRCRSRRSSQPTMMKGRPCKVIDRDQGCSRPCLLIQFSASGRGKRETLAEFTQGIDAHFAPYPMPPALWTTRPASSSLP